MRGFAILMIATVAMAIIVTFVVFPTLEANVNDAQANAARAEQQKLLARAEVEKARALTVTAKGEADALRMSINQPIALLAIPMSLLAIVAVIVLILSVQRQRPQPRQEYRQEHPLPRTVIVYVNGKMETLYVSEGQDPAEAVQHFLAAMSRDLVWIDR